MCKWLFLMVKSQNLIKKIDIFIHSDSRCFLRVYTVWELNFITYRYKETISLIFCYIWWMDGNWILRYIFFCAVRAACKNVGKYVWGDIEVLSCALLHQVWLGRYTPNKWQKANAFAFAFCMRWTIIQDIEFSDAKDYCEWNIEIMVKQYGIW